MYIGALKNMYMYARSNCRFDQQPAADYSCTSTSSTAVARWLQRRGSSQQAQEPPQAAQAAQLRQVLLGHSMLVYY